MGRAGVKVDGEMIVVEFPAGATNAEITSLARQQKAIRGTKPTPPAPPSLGATQMEPDVMGRAKAWLTREGGGTGPTPFGETDWPGRIVRGAGRLLLPGTVPEAARFAATLPIGGGLVTGPLMRTGVGALAGGVAKAAQGGDTGESFWEGGTEGLSQLAGEVIPGGLRFGLGQVAGKKLLGNRAAKIAHDTAMEEAVAQLEKEGYTRDVALRRIKEAAGVREARAQYQEGRAAAKKTFDDAVTAQKTQHEAAVASATEKHSADLRAYEQQGASKIAEAFKQQVPAFKDFPSTEAGLLDMVYGKGQLRMSERFDAALKDIIELGRGTEVEIPLQDARKLGMLRLKVIERERGNPMAMVDAGQLAEKATGFWKTDHGVYRRAFSALDRADIGDPALRGEYRAGQALIQFADKTQMLKGEKFNPEAARSGFTKLKTIDELRRRGQGDIFSGPMSDAVRAPAPELSLPAEPTPLRQPIGQSFRRPAPPAQIPEPPRRVIQDPPMPEGLRVKNLPKLSFWEGAALGEIPYLLGSMAMGHGHAYGGFGIPGAMGGLAAKALGGAPVVLDAPLSGAARFSTNAAMSGFGADAARRLIGE